MEKLLPSQARKILRIDRETLNKWVNRGVLKAKRSSPFGWRVFNKAEIEKLASQLPEKRTRGVALIQSIPTRNRK